MTACRPLFPDILSLNGRWRADKPALITRDRAFTWAQLDGDADRVAHGLIAAGCGGGERVGVVMDNSAEMLSVLFGVMKAGAVAVPLNTSITDEAVNALLADAGASAVIASQAHVRRLSEATLRACRLRIAHAETPPDGWAAFASWRDTQASDDPRAAVGPDDICNIIYSSGTTGQPKGIAHTHGQRLDWAHDLSLALRYDSSARTLIATGLYSNITWVSLLCTTLVGGTLVLMDGFDPAEVLETIERERTTHTSMVPVQYQRLLDHPDFARRDTRSMRAMMCCGSPLPERVKAELFARFPNALIELYGTTEGAVTTLAPEEAEGRIASVGKPIPGGDLAILIDDGVPVLPGEPGEIVTLNRFIMARYWNRPEATAEALWTAPDGRRWLRTGDIGRIDHDGYLTITDRKKDVIISGGQNIYPADLEAVLMRHEAVRECAVIGVPDARWGEAPLALVVAAPDTALQEDALLDWANQRLGRQQRLSGVEWRKDLPRNTNGKVLKRDLRAAYWPDAREGAAGMTADHKPHVWRASDGLRLFARDYGVANDRLPVICIPGLTRNSRDFEDVAPWIAAQGRRVLVVDLRGRGMSEPGPKKRYRPPIYADDMAALLKSIGAQKAVFVGTSLGGLVTLALASRRPRLIGGAVLNDVGPRIAMAGLKRISAYAGRAAPVETWDEAAAYVRRTNGAAFPDHEDADWRVVARRTFREEAGRPVLDYDPAIFSPPSPLVVRLAEPLMWAAFRKLAQAGPLLLVHGELTDVIDGPTVKRMGRMAPHMRTAVVPRVGHAPTLSEPAARQALAGFLAGTP